MNLVTVILIIALVVVLGGGAHYYGPWHGSNPVAYWPGGIGGLIILLIILRLLGII